MNFMGMGSIEIVAILVIAFLALGPSKSIETARNAGRIIRELRKTFSEITSSITLDDSEPTGNSLRPDTNPPRSENESPPPDHP